MNWGSLVHFGCHYRGGGVGLLNNTPIIAMLTPQVEEWADQRGDSASRYLMPLSFAAILGGMTTLIGTSTNLVVSGLLQADGYEPFTMLALTGIALPIRRHAAMKRVPG